MANQKIEEVGEAIRKEFVLTGEKIKQQILLDFEKLLEGDLRSLKGLVE